MSIWTDIYQEYDEAGGPVILVDPLKIYRIWCADPANDFCFVPEDLFELVKDLL